ncbi:organic cation transporter protein-like [Styela clava]
MHIMDADNLDAVVSHVGGLGLYQILWVIIFLIPLSLGAANLAASIFQAMNPRVRCKSPFEPTFRNACSTNFGKFLFPEERGELSKCSRFDLSGTDWIALANSSDDIFTINCNSTMNETIPSVKCTEWEFDRSIMQSTIVTEFNLVCADRWAGYFAQSALMLGVGIGSLVAGFVSDRIGRRIAFLLVCAGAAIFGVSLSFTQNYATFCTMRFFVGFFIYSAFPITFVLIAEITLPKYRTLLGQVLELSFPLGFMLVAMISYYLREWRTIQLAISAPYLIGILIWWLMPESPRWLVQRNRKKEALKVLSGIARINRMPKISEQDAFGTVGKEIKNETEIENKSGAKAVFKSPHLRSTTFKEFYIWFSVSCVYYGLTLNAAELDGDPFRNVCLNALAEIISNFLAIPLINYFGRRLSGSVAQLSAGMLCIILPFVPGAMLPIAILGKFAIAVGFSATYIHTNEIYPTSVRTMGLCACNLMARVGGVLSPIIAMSGEVMTFLPYIIFGIISTIAGGLCLTLPETKGKKLPQTIEDGEEIIMKDSSIFGKYRKQESNAQI